MRMKCVSFSLETLLVPINVRRSNFMEILSAGLHLLHADGLLVEKTRRTGKLRYVVKAKMSLCLINYHAVKTYGGVEV
jgi:hypothetical protein